MERLKSNRVRLAAKGIRELNDRFHAGSLLSEALYSQLRQAGFVHQQCILVFLFPDGGDTYCGQIIRQDGRILAFDMDLGNPEYSSWEDVTDDFRDKYAKQKTAKPWSREVVSFDLFCELGGGSQTTLTRLLSSEVPR